MADLDDRERVEVSSSIQLWDWLLTAHTQHESVWLVTWKAANRDKYVSRDEVLDALIAFGWIDGRRMKLDEERTMQLIAPRQEQAWPRPTSSEQNDWNPKAGCKSPVEQPFSKPKRQDATIPWQKSTI